jgi:hypothetical protein
MDSWRLPLTGSIIIAGSKGVFDTRGFSRLYVETAEGRWFWWTTSRLIRLGKLLRNMSLEETVDYLAGELGLERSGHVREVGQSVAELRD